MQGSFWSFSDNVLCKAAIDVYMSERVWQVFLWSYGVSSVMP